MGKTRVIIYIAAPYTDADPAVREDRFNRVNKFAAKLMNNNCIVFSPITMGHVLAPMLKPMNVTNPDFWFNQEKPFLEACTVVNVLALPGWEQSVGVNMEIEYAKKLNKRIVLVDENSRILKAIHKPLLDTLKWFLFGK